MTISRKVTVFAAVSAVMTTLVTGCDVLGNSDRPTTQQETEEAARELRNRPNLEDSEAQVQRVMEQIASAATELVPTMRFEWVDDRMASECAKPFDRTNGSIVYMRKLWSLDPFPEVKWPAFIAKTGELAGTLGATESQTVRDESSATPDPTPAIPEYGRHDVNFFNSETGTSVRVSTNKATVITAQVGCHLPKGKFDNPIPPTR